MLHKKQVSVKMTSHLNSLLFLFILAFSIFITYRYVKSLVLELKTVKDELLSLTKLNSKNINDDDKEGLCDGNICAFALHGQEEVLSSIVDHIVNDEPKIYDNKDIESVTSEEVMLIVDEINADTTNTTDTTDTTYDLQHTTITDTAYDLQHTTIADTIEENVVETHNDDFFVKKTHSAKDAFENDLSKKTNEELKKVLREHGKSTKGTKIELIKRIQIP